VHSFGPPAGLFKGRTAIALDNSPELLYLGGVAILLAEVRFFRRNALLLLKRQ